MTTILLVLVVVSFVIGSQWDKWDWLRNSVSSVLDPTFGALLSWNVTWGMVIIVIIMQIITTTVQRLTTDPAELRAMKEKQKMYKEEMKKHEGNREKQGELFAQQMEDTQKFMALSFKPLIYTFIPIILFFSWFRTYFTHLGSPKIFGLHWVLFYLIASLIINIPIRKIYKM